MEMVLHPVGTGARRTPATPTPRPKPRVQERTLLKAPSGRLAQAPEDVPPRTRGPRRIVEAKAIPSITALARVSSLRPPGPPSKQSRMMVRCRLRARA